MSAGLSFRFAADGDWETYRDLRLAMLEETPDAFWTTHAEAVGRSEHQWRARAAEGVTVFAEGDGGIVGTLGLLDSDDTIQVIAVYVVPEARGSGVGEALLGFARSEARRRGVDRLVLDVTSNNHPAIALYRRMGFELTGATMRHPRRDDLIERRMQLRLDG